MAEAAAAVGSCCGGALADILTRSIEDEGTTRPSVPCRGVGGGLRPYFRIIFC